MRQSAQELQAKAAAQVNELAERAKTKEASTHGKAAADSVPDIPTPTKAENVDKSELLEILQKMNKKVKALTVIRQQLTTKVESLETDKARLKSLVTDEILNGMVDFKENQDEVLQLQAAWRQVDEQNALNLQHLQNEFQNFRKQSEQQGDSASWEEEKKELLERHEKEMLDLKESLAQNYKAEMEKLRETQSQSSDTAAEVEKVKQAAKAQLLAFKNKVQTARTAELEKLREELLEAAKNELEAKQKEHEAELNALKAEIELQTEKHRNQEASESAIIEELKKKHSQEIDRLRSEAAASLASETDKTRQSVEQSMKNELETKLEQALGEMKKAHTEDLEKVREEAAMLISEVNANAESLKATAESSESAISSLRQQQVQEKEAHKSALESLQKQIDDRERQLKEKQDELQILIEKSSDAASKDDDMAKLKDSHEKELENLRSRLLAEKESALAESQAALIQTKKEAEQKWETEIDASRKDYETKLLEQQKLAREEWIQAKEALERDHETKHESALKALEARANSELESVRSALLKDIESAKDSYDQVNNELIELKAREKDLMKLEETVSKVEASKSGAEESSRLIDEALSRQRASYEEIVEDQRKRVATLEGEIKLLRESSQATAGENASLQSELEKTRTELTRAIEISDKAAAEYERKLSEQAAALKADASDHTKALVQSARDEVISEKNSEIESLKTEFELKLEESKKKEDAIAQSFAKVKAVYAQKLKSTETELKDKIDILEKDKVILTEKLESLEKQLSQSSGERDKANEKLKNEYEAKLKEVEKEKNEVLKSTEEKIALMEKSLGESEARVAEMKTLFDESESNAKQEIEDARSKCESQFESVLNKKSDAIEDLSRKLDEATKAAKESDEQVKQLTNSLEKARSDLKEALETTTDDARKQLQDLENRLKENHDRIVEALKSEHQKAINEIQMERQKDREQFDQLAAQKVEKEKILLSEELGLKIRQLSEEKEELRGAMEKHVDQLTSQFKAKLEESRKSQASEVSSLQEIIKDKEAKCTQAVDQLKKLTASTALLRTEHEKMKKQLATLEDSRKDLIADLENVRKEKEEALASLTKKESSLLEQQETLTNEKTSLVEKIQKLEVELKNKANTTEELQGKLSALSHNLNSIVEEKKSLVEKLARALKQEAKLKSSEGEVAELREQVNMLKLESTKNRNLVERLQSEKEASERSNGQRTALVGLLEKQLSEATDNNSELNAKLEAIKYDMSQREETIQQNMENIRKLQIQLEEAEKKSKMASEALAAVPKGPDAKTKNLVESLQKELQSSRQQMAKKSAAAQKLIQEKEAECVELRKANNALQQEVDKGSLSDRRILELAAKQSNRESQQLSQITARDKTIESMMEKVVERDSQLAYMENKVHEVESQIEELRRVRRREDVNIDYLKSTVVKYLSLPPGSSERAGLLPVLATLLQFDQNDYKVIEDGKAKMSWWGSIAPTLISAHETIPVPLPSTYPSSAEVSVNRQNGDTASRSTT